VRRFLCRVPQSLLWVSLIQHRYQNSSTSSVIGVRSEDLTQQKIVGFAMYNVKPYVVGNREPSHSAIRRHSLGSATFSQFKEFTIGERTLSHMVTS